MQVCMCKCICKCGCVNVLPVGPFVRRSVTYYWKPVSQDTASCVVLHSKYAQQAEQCVDKMADCAHRSKDKIKQRDTAEKGQQIVHPSLSGYNSYSEPLFRRMKVGQKTCDMMLLQQTLAQGH